MDRFTVLSKLFLEKNLISVFQYIWRTGFKHKQLNSQNRKLTNIKYLLLLGNCLYEFHLIYKLFLKL